MRPAELELLLKLRLVLARVGESDKAKWWASDGVLSPTGEYVYERIAPRTAVFARARVAFAIAREQCAAHVPSGSVTLWSLPATIEEAFDDRWSHWLEEATWAVFFQEVEKVETSNALEALLALDLIGKEEAQAVQALKAAPPDKSVRVTEASTVDADLLRLLAAGFGRSTPGHLVVPYARYEA